MDARNQTKIWFFMDVPMEQRARTEIRLSRPVVVQVRQIRSDPRRRTAISEKYWLITWAAGIRLKREFTTMGTKAVT